MSNEEHRLRMSLGSRLGSRAFSSLQAQAQAPRFLSLGSSGLGSGLDVGA